MDRIDLRNGIVGNRRAAAGMRNPGGGQANRAASAGGEKPLQSIVPQLDRFVLRNEVPRAWPDTAEDRHIRARCMRVDSNRRTGPSPRCKLQWRSVRRSGALDNRHNIWEHIRIESNYETESGRRCGFSPRFATAVRVDAGKFAKRCESDDSVAITKRIRVFMSYSAARGVVLAHRSASIGAPSPWKQGRFTGAHFASPHLANQENL